MNRAHAKGLFALNLSIAALSSFCLFACGSESSSSPEFGAEAGISSGDTNPGQNSSSGTKTSSSSSAKAPVKVGPTKAQFLNENLSYGEITDDRDGQTYKTILIGTRYWMAENLNYATENSYCYNDEESNCALYGRLYTWGAAMDSAAAFGTSGANCGNGARCTADSIARGVCPQGWHLPSYKDFSILFGNVGGIRIATRELKASLGFHGSNKNDYGFSAAPAGYRSSAGSYYSQDDGAYFWINRETGDSSAYSARIYDGGTIRANTHYKGDILTDWYFAELNIYDKSIANSVRCVRDTVPGDPTITPISWRNMLKDFPYGVITDERDGRVYRTTTIGTQTWMAENLNFDTEHKFCLHNVDENCDRYGALYQWGDAIDSIGQFSENGKGCGYVGGNELTCEITLPARGICPAGWHVPSSEEFKVLFETVGGQDIAGDMLKTQTEWYKQSGKDAYGFSAFPAGANYRYDMTTVKNTKTFFWTSKWYGRYAEYVLLEYDSEKAFITSEEPDSRRYLRCIKD